MNWWIGELENSWFRFLMSQTGYTFEICKNSDYPSTAKLNLNRIVLFNHPVLWQESRSTNERIYKIFRDILQISWFSTFAQKSDIFTQMEFNLLLDKKNSFNFMEWTFSFRILQEEGKNWNIAINVILDQLAESNLQSWL